MKYLRGIVTAVLVAALTASLPTVPPAGSSALIAPATRDAAWQWAQALARHGESATALSLLSDYLNGETPPEASQVDQFSRLLAENQRYYEAEQVLAREIPGDDDFLHYFRRARLRYLAGHYDETLELLGAIAEKDDPLFGPYRDLLTLATYVESNRIQDAADYGKLIYKGGIPAEVSPEFDIYLIDAFERAGELELAMSVNDNLKVSARDDKVQQLIRDIEFRLGAHDVEGARESALELTNRYWRAPQTEPMVKFVLEEFPLSELTVNELLGYGNFLSKQREYRRARSLFNEAAARTLSAHQKEHLRITEAEHFYRTGQYRRTIELASPKYDVPSFRLRSVLAMARAHRKIGDRGRASQLYQYFARTYPNHGKAAECLHVAASLQEQLGDRATADQIRVQLSTKYPSSYYGKQAALHAARRAVTQQKFDTGKSILEKLLARRQGDEAALYYLADAYHRSGKANDSKRLLSELESVDPNSFYLAPYIRDNYRAPAIASTGNLALFGPDGMVTIVLAAEAERANSRDHIAGVAAAGSAPLDECLVRGEWFLSAGFREWGERELLKAARRCGRDSRALSDLARVYDEYGMPWRSVRMYSQVRSKIRWNDRSELSADFRRMLHPIPHPYKVLQHAATYDLPPHLVYAMIRQESMFEPDARSHVGATGLMQLMPATAEWVARQMEVPRYEHDMLLDPETNIAFGTWYASSLMDASGGNALRMLAAYNAGPRNAHRWFDREGEANTIIDLVDGIDYRETRNYVHRIVEGSHVYHDLYFSRDASAR